MPANNTFRAASLLPLLAGAGMMACSPSAVTDLGLRVTEPAVYAKPLFWSRDNSLLYYSAIRDHRYVLETVGLRDEVVRPVFDSPHPVKSEKLVASDSLLYFLESEPSAGNALFQIPLQNGQAGTPVPIANNVWDYTVSLDGTRVAMQSSSGLLTTLDIPTGTQQSFGRYSPGEFSPDGSRLLTKSLSPTEQASTILADPATGAVESIAIVGRVVAWDGGRPRRVVKPNVVVDLVTGAEVPLENESGDFEFYSGDPANLDAGYYGFADCLKHETTEDGDRHCQTTQNSLLRVDLNSGRRDVVARWANQTITFAISQDGQMLASAVSDWETDDAAIYVKTLSPGP